MFLKKEEADSKISFGSASSINEWYFLPITVVLPPESDSSGNGRPQGLLPCNNRLPEPGLACVRAYRDEASGLSASLNTFSTVQG